MSERNAWKSKTCEDCYFNVNKYCRRGPLTFNSKAPYPQAGDYPLVYIQKEDDYALACSEWKADYCYTAKSWHKVSGKGWVAEVTGEKPDFGEIVTIDGNEFMVAGTECKGSELAAIVVRGEK